MRVTRHRWPRATLYAARHLGGVANMQRGTAAHRHDGEEADGAWRNIHDAG